MQIKKKQAKQQAYFDLIHFYFVFFPQVEIEQTIEFG